MATITSIQGHLDNRLEELFQANNATVKFDKAYICDENGADIKDDIANVNNPIEIDMTITRVDAKNYLITLEKNLQNATDWDRIYIVNSSGKTLLVVDVVQVTGATTVYENINYVVGADCGEVK